MSSFYVAVTSDSENRLVDDAYRSFSHSSVHDVSRALNELLIFEPSHFANTIHFVALSGKFRSFLFYNLYPKPKFFYPQGFGKLLLLLRTDPM